MKPTKNRVFCRDALRHKMVFETEKKANNFIKFNKEEVLQETGVTLERSYFCMFCSGWHITSLKNKILQSKNEKILEQLKAIGTTVAEQPKRSLAILKKEDISFEIEQRLNKMTIEEAKEFLYKEKEDLELKINELVELNQKTEELRNLRYHLEIIFIKIKAKGFSKEKKELAYNKKINDEWQLWIESKNL